jgi:hypothetical protein
MRVPFAHEGHGEVAMSLWYKVVWVSGFTDRLIEMKRIYSGFSGIRGI